MNERPSGWSAVKSAWRVAAGGVLAGMVVWRLGPSEFAQALVTLPGRALVPAVLVALLPPVFHAWRWRSLLGRTLGAVSLLDAVRVTVAASVANYALPVFGWVPAKVVVTRRWLGIRARTSVATIVLEYGIDALVLLVASVVGLLLLGVRVPLDELARVLGRWGVAVALAAFVLGVVILLGVPMAWRHGSSRVCRGLWQSWVVVGRVSRDPVVWAATAGRWGAEFLLLTLLVQASGLSLSASAIVTLIGVSSFIGLVAPVPGGLGAREAAGVVLATAYGWSPVGVGAVLVWYRIAAVIGLAVVGVGSALAWRWMRCGG